MEEMAIKRGEELCGALITGVCLSGVWKSTVVQAHFERKMRRMKMDCCGLKGGPSEKTVALSFISRLQTETVRLLG